MHLMAWEKVCSPKQQGGLDFRDLKRNNDAHMMKLAWQLTKNGDKLWVQVLRDKYKCGFAVLPRIKHRQNCSNVWRGITHIWDDFMKGVTWRLGDGRTIRFCQDPWFGDDSSLECHINISLSNDMREMKVCEFVGPDGNWNGNIMNLLPRDLADSITLVPPPYSETGCDIVAWAHTSDSEFSIKSA